MTQFFWLEITIQFWAGLDCNPTLPYPGLHPCPENTLFVKMHAMTGTPAIVNEVLEAPRGAKYFPKSIDRSCKTCVHMKYDTARCID
jgi:hypothetical protein